MSATRLPSTSGPRRSRCRRRAAYADSSSRPCRSRPRVDISITAACGVVLGPSCGCAPLAPATWNAVSADARGQRVLHVERLAIDVAGTGTTRTDGLPGRRDRVAHVVGRTAAGLPRSPPLTRRRRAGKCRVGRLIGAERHGGVAGGAVVDREGTRVARASPLCTVATTGSAGLTAVTAVRRRARHPRPDRRPLRHRRAVAGVPADFLQVGDDDDRAVATGEMLRRAESAARWRVAPHGAACSTASVASAIRIGSPRSRLRRRT